MGYMCIHSKAKPLPDNEVAVVVFNRNGTTSTCNINTPHNSFAAPCDDVVAESSGAQQIQFDFDTLPREWFVGGKSGNGVVPAHNGGGGGGGGGDPIKCNVRDVFSGVAAAEGKDLGLFTGTFDAGVVPPHGVRFLLLSKCST